MVCTCHQCFTNLDNLQAHSETRLTALRSLATWWVKPEGKRLGRPNLCGKYLIFNFMSWRKWIVNCPRIEWFLLAIKIVIATICSHFGEFQHRFNVTIVDHIPTGLPQPDLPRLDLWPGMIGNAIGLAIVVFSITVSMAKIYAKRHNYNIDANQVYIHYILGLPNKFRDWL